MNASRPAPRRAQKRVLVIDVGGTHVKLRFAKAEERRFDSGPEISPQDVIAGIKANVRGWKFDAISLGFPAPIRDGKVTREPSHLRPGWIGWNFRRSLGKPVRVINDAAMQAIGSYRGGRMLFLGLGTGLGSALTWPGTVLSLELGRLPWRDSGTIENWVGNDALHRLGHRAWRHEVVRAVGYFQLSLIADRVVIGGGNARLLRTLPPNVELGSNELAFLGGQRLWETVPRTKNFRWQVL